MVTCFAAEDTEPFTSEGWLLSRRSPGNASVALLEPVARGTLSEGEVKPPPIEKKVVGLPPDPPPAPDPPFGVPCSGGELEPPEGAPTVEAVVFGRVVVVCCGRTVLGTDTVVVVLIGRVLVVVVGFTVVVVITGLTVVVTGRVTVVVTCLTVVVGKVTVVVVNVGFAAVLSVVLESLAPLLSDDDLVVVLDDFVVVLDEVVLAAGTEELVEVGPSVVDGSVVTPSVVDRRVVDGRATVAEMTSVPGKGPMLSPTRVPVGP